MGSQGRVAPQAPAIIKLSAFRGQGSQGCHRKGVACGQPSSIYTYFKATVGCAVPTALPDGAHGRPCGDVTLKSQSVSEPPTTAMVVILTVSIITL